MNKNRLAVFTTLFVLIFVMACEKDPPIEPVLEIYAYEEGEELLGGTTTVFDVSPNAFGNQIPGLTSLQGLNFFVGNSFFNQNWVTAPSTTTARDGLGPMFNSKACSGCHFKDGRGRPPVYPGELGTGFLVRLSIPGVNSTGAPLPDLNYGGQIQDQAILGVTKEADISINYTNLTYYFADGESYSLQTPLYNYLNFGYGSLDVACMFSPRVAQQMIGLGLLETVEESTILVLQDISDSNNDGISGKANYVWDSQSSLTKIGKFGWKANQPNLYQQTAGAFLGDMGITTNLFPLENCTSPQLDCQAATTGGAPEIIDEDLEKVVLYVQTLAVPARRNYKDQIVLKGKKLFSEIGCNKCHLSSLVTGINATISPLSNQTIHPYTDLLLHDLGAGLADNRMDFLANGNEWRTPPLWGIGLIQTVNGHTNLLHDGRARNILEAIMWHGGEAEQVKLAFKNLQSNERAALVKFIESL